jgi:hypothetical protein
MNNDQQPQLKHCNKFGTTCYYINKIPKNKLQPKAIQAIFLGLTEENNYIVLDPTTNLTTTTRNIKFSNLSYEFPNTREDSFNDDPQDEDYNPNKNNNKSNIHKNNNKEEHTNAKHNSDDTEIEELIQDLIKKDKKEEQEEYESLQNLINFNQEELQSESDDKSIESSEETERKELPITSTLSNDKESSSTNLPNESIQQINTNLRRSNRTIRSKNDPLYGTKDREFIKQHWNLTTANNNQSNTHTTRSFHQVLITQVFNTTTQPNNPITYQEAINNPLWKESIQKEIKNLTSMNTWTYINHQQIPKSAKIIGSRYVF